MSRLPRFTSTQGVAEGRLPAGDQGAQALSSLGRQIQSFGERELLRGKTKEAQQLGELAGLNENFKEVEGGVAAQAFNRAALATNKQMVSGDIILGTQQIKQRALAAHPDAAEALNSFNANMKEFTDNTVSSIPEGNRAFAQNMLNFHAGQVQMQLQGEALKQQRTRAAAEMMVQDSALRDSWLNSIQSINYNAPDDLIKIQEDAAKHTLMMQLTGLKLGAQGGLLKNNEAVIQSEKSFREFNNEIMAQKYKALLAQGDPKKEQTFIDNIQKNPPKGFNAFQTRQLQHKLLQIKQTFANTSKQNQALLKQKMKDEHLAVQNGAEPNVKLRSAVALALPNTVSLYDQRIEDDQSVNQMRNSVILSPFKEQDAALNSLRPTDKNDPDFGRHTRLFNDVTALVRKSNTEINNDKVAYFKSRPEIINAFNNEATRHNAGVNFDAIDNEGIKPLSNDPNHRLIAAERQKGFAKSQLSILTNEEAKGIVNTINNLSPQERVNAFRSFQEKQGDLYPIFMKNLVDQGKMSQENVFLAGMDPQDSLLPEVVESINTPTKDLKGALHSDALKDFKTITENPSKWPTDWKDYLASTEGFKDISRAKFVSGANNFVQNVTLAIMGRGVSASDAFEQATKTISGANNYLDIGGQTIAIPKQYNEDTIRDGLKRKEKLLKSFDFSPSLGTGVGTTRQDDFDQNIKTGHWVNNSSGTGALWVNQNGTAIHDLEGNMFDLSFNDASENQIVSSDDIKSSSLVLGPLSTAFSAATSNLPASDIVDLVEKRVSLEATGLTTSQIEKNITEEALKLQKIRKSKESKAGG